MSNGHFTSPHEEEKIRFRDNLGLLIIIATVLVSALVGWFLVQQKVQISEQQTVPAGTSSNAVNNFRPLDILSASNAATTNLSVIPLASPFNSLTN